MDKIPAGAMDDVAPDRKYSKEDASLHLSIMEMLFYNLRHVQHHAARQFYVEVKNK